MGLSASSRLVAIRSTGHHSFSAEFEKSDGTRFVFDSTLERDEDGNVRQIADFDLISDGFVGTAGELRAIYGAIRDFCLVAQEEHPQQVSARESFLATQASRHDHERERERDQIAEVLRRFDEMPSGGSASSVLQAVHDEIGLEDAALRQALMQRFGSVEEHRNAVHSIVWHWSVSHDHDSVDRLFRQLTESEGGSNGN